MGVNLAKLGYNLVSQKQIMLPFYNMLCNIINVFKNRYLWLEQDQLQTLGISFYMLFQVKKTNQNLLTSAEFFQTVHIETLNIC